jgi:transcriptional regulator with XRE-family HTH domain
MSSIADVWTNDEVAAQIGTRLRARRLERNHTVDAVAEATGLNRKTILTVERGGDVRFSTVVKLLRHLDLFGALDAAFPDTLPGAEAFSTRGRPRQRASSARPRRGRSPSGRANGG